jgi:leucine dehydrogenase
MDYDRETALQQTRKIYDTTLEIFSKAEQEHITTHQAALKLAKERIANAKKIH